MADMFTFGEDLFNADILDQSHMIQELKKIFG